MKNQFFRILLLLTFFSTSKPPNLEKVFLIFIYLFFAGRWCPFYWGKGLHSPIKDRSHREMHLSANYQGRFSRLISISCVWIAEDISSTNNTNLSLIWFNWMAMIREKDCFFFCCRLFASYPSGQKWAKQYALVNLKLKIEFDKKMSIILPCLPRKISNIFKSIQGEQFTIIIKQENRNFCVRPE